MLKVVDFQEVLKNLKLNSNKSPTAFGFFNALLYKLHKLLKNNSKETGRNSCIFGNNQVFV